VQRQFVMTGFCGGFTTFSIFSLETILLLEAGDLRTAGASVGASLVLWFAAVATGSALGTRFNRLRR
jgi:CrcB protein